MYCNTEVKEISINSPHYPQGLKQLKNPPETLYVRGFLPYGRPVVAVIGARFCSSYGRYAARQIGMELVRECGCSVINGMALGIDGIAAKAALDADGEAFAVMGCGPDVIYPPENADLYDQLLKQGGIISQFELGTKPMQAQFVERNELIAALCDAVVVVEAREKSAIIDLVHKAQALGKKVFVMPGRVTDQLSKGTNALIREGAEILLDTSQVAEYFRRLSERGCVA